MGMAGALGTTYIINVGTLGRECVREYGVRKTTWAAKNVGMEEVGAYATTCTVVTLTCEFLLKVGSFGTDVGLRARDIAVELLGCGIAPAIST